MRTYDSGDLDVIQGLVRERGYELLRKRMEQTIEQMVEQLVQPCTEEKTAELRGGIGAIRLCMLMPKILEQEIRKGMKDAG